MNPWKHFAIALVLCGSLNAAVQTSFEEASLSPNIFLDVPNAALGSVSFDATNDELDFNAGGNTDMWGTRNNAPIAWTAIPAGLANGSTWTVESEVRINNVSQNNQVAGLTFYGGPDGARPDISFGLDNWDPAGRAVRLQGLGDNNPNTAITTTASSVFLRVVVQENGATDTYNFFYKVNAGDVWTQIPGVAINYQTNFANSRVAMTYKTGAAKAGAAFTFFNVADTSSQPPVITTQPAALTAFQGGVGQFSVVATGASSYQWRRNTVNISPGGNLATLRLDPIAGADNGASYDCIVTNANGSTTSNAAVLTTATPVVGGSYYFSAVQAEPSLFAYFPVDGSASPAVTNVKNPSFSGIINGDTTHDSTAARTVGVKSVRSNGAGWIGVTKDPEWDFPDGSGTIEMFVYHTAAAGYNPSMIAVRNDAGGGTRYSFHADATGVRIWYFNGTGAPTWTLPSNSIGRLMHLAFVITPWQCTLYHNGVSLGSVNQTIGGGVNLPAEIGSAGPSAQESFPGSIDDVALYADPLPASAITAHYNAWLTATAGTAPSISAHPANSSVNEGDSATFTVSLANPTGANYRWQKNGVDIPGATSASYTLSPAMLVDHSAQFRCVIYNSFGGALTNVATLTVVDVNPPVLVSASAPISQNQLILTFNEPVDLSTATFSISGGGSVVGVVSGPVPGMVTLTVSGLAAGQTYTVTANNVRDLTGNVLSTANTGFTAAPPPIPAPVEVLRPAAETMGPATRRGPFVFSEIYYHPRDTAAPLGLEFIEIHNTQPWTEDLTGFRLTGDVSFTFPSGTVIPAGGRIVVAGNPTDVQTHYTITGVLGPWEGSLDSAGGLLRLRDKTDGVVAEVETDDDPPWPVGADGAGHSLVLARPSYGMSDSRAWNLSFAIDGSPGSAEPAAPDPYSSVVVNEVLANPASLANYIELYNYSSGPVDVSGCSLNDERELEQYVLPASTIIPAGGFLSVDVTTLGFEHSFTGDTIYFRAPGSGGFPGRLLDAVRYRAPLPGRPWGRFPDGARHFSHLDAASAGITNTPPASKAAVISEICYNPPTGTLQLPFVEITNLSGSTLNLGGWYLRGGISYDFPAGTMLAPNAKLAVNAFSGRLNAGVGESLRLEMDVEVVLPPPGGINTVRVVVDETTYNTGGRWGRWSDGGGSSLEKTDLRADARFPSNWADSNETAESDWVTIQTTGVLDNGSGSAINRLHVMLLGAGECLLDDVEVIPSGGSNVVTNGGFESGTTGWLRQGTHDGSTVVSGGFSGANALHVMAEGRGDLSGNRLTVPLTASLGANTTATIRAKVKWRRGHPEILLRLAGGVLEATGNILPTSVTVGSPGTTNHSNTANAGPAIRNVSHLPVLPQAGQTATVYAELTDPDNIGLAVLRYRLDPATTQNSVVMSYRGAGIFSAEIPAQASGTLAAFSIAAYDSPGGMTTFPANGKEGLIRWGDATPTGSLGVYRLWMTEATRSLWASRIKNSNTPLDVTFVYNNQRVIYNANAQYSGSPWHTGGFTGPTGANCDYDCSVPSDDRFLDATDFILAGPGTFGDDASFIREQMIWWIARNMGLQSIHRRFCRVVINGTQRQTVFEDTQQPNGEWIDQYWPDDNDGRLHKAQDWIEYADDGATFGTTLRAHLTKATTTGGIHKNARYRFQWAARSVADSVNDWSALNGLIDAFASGTGGNDAAFFNAVDPLVDQDSWSRALAVQRISGNWDTWGWRFGKNMYMYKPTRGPWVMTAWDIDFSFGLVGESATISLFTDTQDPLATKFRDNWAFRRSYWCAYREAVDGPMLPAAANARIDAMVAGLAANGITANAAQVTTVKNYITARRDYIITQLNAAYPGTTFTISGSNNLTDADGILTISGTAPPGVKRIRINAVEYVPNWTSETAWNLPLTLYAAANSFAVEGLSLGGAVLSSFPLTINVTGPPPLPPVTINEWMADNTSGSGFADPADSNYEDWFELHNSGATTVNLGGFYLTDNPANPTQFQIPSGTVIPAGGYLLIWADNETEQNGVTPNQLHTNFRLSANGEQLALYTPDGNIVNQVSFGPQNANESQGRYPDSTAGIVSPVPTPGKRNALAPDIIAVVDAGAGVSAVTISIEPTHIYQIESSTDLNAWSNWGAPITASGTTATLNLPRSDSRRFWRATIQP